MGIVDTVFENSLVGGVVMACAAVVVLSLLRREDSVRPGAWWVSETAVSIIFAPLITIVSASGGMLFIIGLNNLAVQPVTLQGWITTGAALLVAWAALTLLTDNTVSQTGQNAAAHRNMRSGTAMATH